MANSQLMCYVSQIDTKSDIPVYKLGRSIPNYFYLLPTLISRNRGEENKISIFLYLPVYLFHSSLAILLVYHSEMSNIDVQRDQWWHNRFGLSTQAGLCAGVIGPSVYLLKPIY